MTSAWLKYASLLFCAAALWACSGDGFTKLPSGGKWKLLSFGEQDFSVDTAKMAALDYCVIHLRTGDTLLNVIDHNFEVGKDELWQVLRGCYQGDSLTSISVIRDFLHPGQYRYDTLQYFIHISDLLSRAELETARLQELTRMDSIAASDSIADYYDPVEGILMRPMVLSFGSKVEEGKEVVIHYRGYDTYGRIIDDTRLRNQPLRFVMGNEHQVIEGLEIALNQMKKGEKCRVIIPSWLAFGSRGSGGGVVPPHTPLVYELEILEVGI